MDGAATMARQRSAVMDRFVRPPLLLMLGLRAFGLLVLCSFMLVAIERLARFVFQHLAMAQAAATAHLFFGNLLCVPTFLDFAMTAMDGLRRAMAFLGIAMTDMRGVPLAVMLAG